MTLEVLESLRGVTATEWDALVPPNDPFTTHAFLGALEESGCVGPGTGWVPRHVVLRGASGALVGAMPLYLKDDSYGEYIFDWAWAEAAHGAGMPYYPKLVSAVPFTPATGARLLVKPGRPRGPVVSRLIEGARTLAAQEDASSIHLLFLTESELAEVGEGWCAELGGAMDGFLPRLSYQFNWQNRGYRDFEHYLAAFRSPARKQVRRERRRLAGSELQLVTLQGAELDDAQWQALWSFYRDTTSRKWGQAYLNEGFFQRLRSELSQHVWATLAQVGDRVVAGALLLQRGQHLYGRYWGALEDHDGLHFELCYYRPIELCIQQGWTRFEAGAQGVHKLKRGLLPGMTYSAHWIADPALRQGVAEYVLREALVVKREVRRLDEHGPFRRDAGGGVAGQEARCWPRRGVADVAWKRS
jgi:uncharacterized protein